MRDDVLTETLSKWEENNRTVNVKDFEAVNKAQTQFTEKQVANLINRLQNATNTMYVSEQHALRRAAQFALATVANKLRLELHYLNAIGNQVRSWVSGGVLDAQAALRLLAKARQLLGNYFLVFLVSCRLFLFSSFFLILFRNIQKLEPR
jgi:hypothetical protein